MAAFSPSTAKLTEIEITKERRQTRALDLSVDGFDALNNMSDDFLRLSSFQGQEAISQPYEFKLELRANDVEQLSNSQVDQLLSLNTLEVIGLWANVRISRAWSRNRFERRPLDDTPNWENNTPSRFFQGVITSMSMAAPGVYQLSLSSPLHHLTLRNRYYIYQDCDIRTLFTTLLANETLSGKLRLQFRFDESPTISRNQDWLQAGESDFAFMQRVAGRTDVHFYFIHHRDYLSLVFSNRPTALQEVAIPECPKQALQLRYSYSNAEALGLQQDDLFCDLNYQVKLVQNTVGAVLTREQAQWEHNDVAGFTSYDAAEDENTAPQYLLHHRYAYGTSLSEAEGQLVKARQGIATERGTLSGASTSPLLSPGYTFKLTQPVGSAAKGTRLMRQSFSERSYVVTSIQHQVSDTKPYKGNIQATEVNVSADGQQGTLLSPFSMDRTQQGSVLAKVLETAVPRGWRYRQKSNFQVEQKQNEFEGQAEKEKGCLVRLATARDDNEMFWVRLGQSSQTAPEVGAMVMISRANNDSELPEISVIASHGSKTIQPADRRSQSWTANTSWGSNYSTNYGDSISIRYGYNSPVNLQQAKVIVESAYDQPDMMGQVYDNSSFSRGGNYSVSVSNNDADGVIGASVSMGSSFNENHAKVSYSYGDTETSQHYSLIGKSVSRSIIGDYKGTIDFDQPSFINGKVPEQSIIDIADTLNMGDTYNENHTKGRSISLSGSGAPPPSFSGTSAISYNDSVISGNTEQKSKHTGNSKGSSTHIGDSDNSSLNIGNSSSVSTQIGNVAGVNTFLGTRSDLSTTLGMTNNVETFIGLKNILSTKIAANNTINTSVGPSSTIDTNIGTSDTVATHISASNTSSTNVSASNTTSTNIGVSNSMSTKISASNNMETNIGSTNNIITNLSASNTISTNISTSNTIDTTLGMKTVTATTLGMNNTTSINAATSISNNIHMGFSMDTSMNLGTKIINSNNAGAEIRNSIGAAAEIINDVKPIRITATNPLTDISTEALTKIEMLAMKISM
jgi:type VI secretion system secreted protein VgrG